MNQPDAGRKMQADRLTRQTATLVAFQGASIVLAFGLTVLLARALDVAAYGQFRFAIIFLSLGMTVAQFGLPYSAARLMALEPDGGKQGEIVGASCVIVGLCTVAGVIAVIVASLGAHLAGWSVPSLLIWIAPALYVTLGQAMVGSLCQGANRIDILGYTQVLPYVFLIPITALQIVAFGHYSLEAALLTYVAIFSGVLWWSVRVLNGSLRRLSLWLRAISAENVHTGFPIYIGGLLGVASTQVIAMWVVAYASAEQYGQYALALALAAPLGVLVSSVGTVIFRSSATRPRLSGALILASFCAAILLGILFFGVTEYLLTWIFGEAYGPAASMAQLLAVGFLSTGLGDIFQRFLGAHGLGRLLGLGAGIAGLCGIVVAAALLPTHATTGAIIASMVSGVVYLALMVAAYGHFTRSRPMSPVYGTKQ